MNFVYTIIETALYLIKLNFYYPNQHLFPIFFPENSIMYIINDQLEKKDHQLGYQIPLSEELSYLCHMAISGNDIAFSEFPFGLRSVLEV